ncbi:MAG: TonB-dependent receptor [Vicinamibacteria bacterium]
MRIWIRPSLLSYTLALAATAGAAETGTGTVTGRVFSSPESPAADAKVTLVDLRRQTRADAAGAFRFEDVPAGLYVLQADSARFGSNVTRVEVTSGQAASVEMTLDLATHQETVVVTARGEAATLNELASPVDVLSGQELQDARAATLGETLARQPGVSSTSFGPGASRPVIRGLGGDRIRVLQGGLGTADASNTSPDHAVSFDPLSARQIEIVRGPATLLYGSNAVGGVVNVIDGSIPDAVPDRPLSATVDLAGGTSADERTGAAALSGGRGMFAWHADLLKRRADDVSIPGFAESAALRAEEAEEGETHEEAEGVLENSAIDSTGGSAGVALIGRGASLGVAFSGFDTLYGVPGHAHAEEGAEEEGPVRIDLTQRRLDLRGEVLGGFGPFRSAKVRLGRSDYDHVELEGAKVGTRFTNEAWEGRLELPHDAVGPVQGMVGVQVAHRDFAAIGAEAFVPPTVTRTLALFALEEVGRGPVKLQLGARFETQDTDAKGEAPQSRREDGASGSLGVLWNRGDDFSAGLTVARSVKLPTAEELFSNGPHLATRAFELGDPDLERERSLGVDLSVKKRRGRVAGEVSLFANRFDGFIFEQRTGDVQDGLEVVRFVQRDAEFVGAEASATVDLLHREPDHLDVELMADTVRAELRDTGEPLPRITPARVGAALHYRGERWNGRVEVRRTAAQDRVAPLERPTDGFTFLNASLGYRFFSGRTVVDLLLRGTNLTDAEGRNHVSFLKDEVPLPGRDVRLGVRVAF